MLVTYAAVFLAIGILVAISLLYGREIERKVLFKYWVISLIGMLFIGFFCNAPFIAGLFGIAMAFALFAKALFPSTDY